MATTTPLTAIAIFLSAMLCMLNTASSQTTAPAAQAVDCSTPMAFMVSYDGLAGQDPPAYTAMYFIDGDDDTQRLARAQAKFDAEVGMLQKIVHQKWGDDGVDQLLHAMGLTSLHDIQAATIKESGHHASVKFANGTPGPDLVKTNGSWRLDLPAFTKSLGIPVDDYLKQIRQLSKIIPDVADGIANETLKDPSAMVSEIVKRINTPAR